MGFPFLIAAEVIAMAIGAGLDINGAIKDGQEIKLTAQQRKEQFLQEVANMPYLSKYTILELDNGDVPPSKTSYYGIPLPNDDWILLPQSDPNYVEAEVGDKIWKYWRLHLWSDGAGNLVNWTRAKEMMAEESTQGCNEGEKHSRFYVGDYYNPYIEDFLDYERFKGESLPVIIGCCPEKKKFNGLQCVPNETEFTKRTPQQAADFDCRVAKGKNYVGVLNDPNHTDIELPFTFKCILNAESQAKVDFLDCLKQGGSYESCESGGTTTTTGVSDAIDYMMTINEGGEEDDEEEEIETPPPTTPPPTDTGMSDADRERLNNYRRRRF